MPLTFVWVVIAAVIIAAGTLMKSCALLMVGDLQGARSEITETFNH